MTLVRSHLLCIVLLLSVLTSACASQSAKLPADPVNFRPPDVTVPAPGSASYLLSPGDVITVKVYEIDTLSGDQMIDSNGRITLPLLGLVKADQLTATQVGEEISRELAARYLQSPHVIVTLKTAVEKNVTVDGAVKNPGVYTLTSDTTHHQTIDLAKGTVDNANLRRVVIFRTIGGTRRASAFDLVTIRKGKDPDPKVYPNDLIVVDGSSLTSGYRLLLRSIPLLAFGIGL